MIESSLTERPSPLRAVSHLYLIVDLLHPLVCLGVKTCQHTPWLGQWCSGLSGLTNCLVYVILSAAGINVAWPDCGQSVCNPIIFSKPRPLNPLVAVQTWRPHVSCCCVTEGWPGQYSPNEAPNVWLSSLWRVYTHNCLQWKYYHWQ